MGEQMKCLWHGTSCGSLGVELDCVVGRISPGSAGPPCNVGRLTVDKLVLVSYTVGQESNEPFTIVAAIEPVSTSFVISQMMCSTFTVLNKTVDTVGFELGNTNKNSATCRNYGTTRRRVFTLFWLQNPASKRLPHTMHKGLSAICRC